MLDDAFPRFEAEIEAIECGIALFELIDNAQALQVVFKTAVVGHAIVQRILPGMTKRGVPQVMCQRDSFHQILVETQRAGDAAPDLGNLKAMRQTRAKQVTFVIDENLRLVFEATKCRGVNDAVAVSLKLAA